MGERHVDKLISRAARGDVRAFGCLYDEYADRVHGYVRLRVRDARDAEELTETVFLRIWDGLPHYEVRGIPFTAWVFRIARNAVVDFHRAESRRPDLAEEAEAADLPSGECVDEEVLARLDAERVRGAIGRLTEEQAAVVTMRFLWGCTLADCAGALDRTEGAVKALQHRALRSMSRLLSEEA